MIKQQTVDYDELGFWRHFAFVRFLFKQVNLQSNELEKRNDRIRELEQEVSELRQDRVLTGDIKNSNNKTERVIRDSDEEDDRDDSFYERRPHETIEQFIKRISYSTDETSETVVPRSANDIIEQARKDHLQFHSTVPASITVSDSAIDRIANNIKPE